MTSVRTFRFAVQCRSATSGDAWREQVRRIEDLGYSTVYVPDHFEDQWAPTIAMAIAAEVTASVNVGALVYGVDYRHPLVLAKEMATLDLATEGRVEFGLGAGWMKTDYESAGITYDRPGVRIDRMIEAVEITRGLWSGEPFSYHGAHFDITDAIGTPMPHTSGGPPIVIGGGGRQVLSAAARLADIVSMTASLHEGELGAGAIRSALGGRFEERRAWIAAAAGDRFAELELQLHTFMVQVTDDVESLFEALAPGFGLTVDEARTSPMVLAGSVDAICEQLEHHRERYGTSYVVIHEGEIDAFVPVVAKLTGT